MKHELRASTPADAPGIERALRGAGLATERLEHMQWKYWTPQPGWWPGSRSFIASRGPDIVAHLAVVPGLFTWEGRQIRVVHGVDWASLPNAAGAGVSLMRHVAQLVDCLFAVGGSRDAQRVLPRVGFESAGMVTGYVLPLRPLHLPRAAPGPAWKLPARIARRIWWRWAAPRSRRSQWNARALGSEQTRVIAPVLSSVGRVEARSPALEGMAVLHRSEPVIRHVLGCPIVPMRLFALEYATAVRGYVMLAFPPGQARIADCWVDSPDLSEWCESIHCAVAMARQWHEAAEVVAWASDPILGRALLACGFHARTTEPIRIRFSASGCSSVPRLRVQMIDNDGAYWHLSEPQLLI